MSINESMARAKRDKWLRHIGRIEMQVIRLMDFRRWNAVYEAIVNANPRLNPGIPVLNYFRHIYADYATLAVRRQSKPHKDSISLLELIDDMSKFPEALTLEWTVDLYSRPSDTGHIYPMDVAKELANLTFKQYADPTGSTFDGTIAAADAVRLTTMTSKIVALADRTVAHDDKRISAEFSTFDELDAAIVLIAELTSRYKLLLTGHSLTNMTPIDQSNAIQVFSFRWIDPENLPDLTDRTSL